MAAPTTSLDWATETVVEYIQSPSGETVLVLNKVEPSVATQLNGVQARQPHIRPYYNYQMNSNGQWINYLRSGEIGQPRLESPTTTAPDMAVRYGGTWTDHGTDTFAGQTLKLFRRVT